MVGAVCGRGVCIAGACMAGGHVWQEREPLQWMVHILLEYILVYLVFLAGNPDQ